MRSVAALHETKNPSAANAAHRSAEALNAVFLDQYFGVTFRLRNQTD